MNTEYKIEAIADFLVIPDEKLASCLEDFAAWIRVSRRAADYEKVLGDMLDAKGQIKMIMDGFTWRDDGISGVRAFDIESDGESLGRIEVPEQRKE
jgi:hypothetical protein